MEHGDQIGLHANMDIYIEIRLVVPIGSYL